MQAMKQYISMKSHSWQAFLFYVRTTNKIKHWKWFSGRVVKHLYDKVIMDANRNWISYFFILQQLKKKKKRNVLTQYMNNKKWRPAILCVMWQCFESFDLIYASHYSLLMLLALTMHACNQPCLPPYQMHAIWSFWFSDKDGCWGCSSISL